LQDQHRFDAQHLGFGGNGDLLAPILDLGGFQRLLADQLPHTSFNAVQTTENLDRTSDAGRLPAGYSFQISQDLIKALAEVGQYVVGVGG